MTSHPIYDPAGLMEAGRLLKLGRTQQNLSMQAMCNKLGMRVAQIEAMEAGNAVYFQNTGKPFSWFARLYAKKLAVELPDGLLDSPQSSPTAVPKTPPSLPPFY
jgi:cytoskeletal protein RodZ